MNPHFYKNVIMFLTDSTQIRGGQWPHLAFKYKYVFQKFKILTLKSFFNLKGNGNYIYFEASFPVKTGEEAVLRTPPIMNGTASKCMKFAYHMHGSTMGELRLEKVYPDGTTRTLLFRNTEVEDAWKEHKVYLPIDTVNYEVTFVLYQCFLLARQHTWISLSFSQLKRLNFVLEFVL